MTIALDYTSRVDPALLRAAGVSVVCRYVAPQAWKVITRAEYAELLEARITVFLNWESSETDWLRGAAGGAADAAMAAKMAGALGYPQGSVIIGSCDFDITQQQADGVGRDYANAFKKTLAARGYLAGVYGPKRALDIGQQLGFAFGWQSMSTGFYGNGALHPFANLRQLRPYTLGSADADLNQIIHLPPVGDDVSAHLEAVVDAWRNGNPIASDGSNIEPVKWQQRTEDWQKAVSGALIALSAATKAGFTDAQVATIAQSVAAALVASNANGLTPADHAGVQADVQAALVGVLAKVANAA